jgi:uncharacterized protein YceH (UPF0502 family)
MSSLSLAPIEARILGCLLEKERITPENYPLSLNSLTAACNQSTNRDPVTSYDRNAIERGLDSLREKKLATVLFGAGSRVQKYRHNLLDHFNLGTGEIALLCVLVLRGPQTLGELRTRTDRMHHFGSLEDVESTLQALGKDEVEFVKVSPARSGQKEKRYFQTLSEPSEVEPEIPQIVPVKVQDNQSHESRTVVLERHIAAIRRQLDVISEELETLKTKA